LKLRHGPVSLQAPLSATTLFTSNLGRVIFPGRPKLRERDQEFGDSCWRKWGVIGEGMA
jgi:hypothetical protein